MFETLDMINGKIIITMLLQSKGLICISLQFTTLNVRADVCTTGSSGVGRCSQDG